MEIKRAFPEDLTDTVIGEIGCFMNAGFLEEGADWKFNPETFGAFWKFVISKGIGAMFLLKRGLGTVGIATVLADINPLTGEYQAMSVNWRLESGLKGLGWGAKLLDAVEFWAVSMGVKRLIVHCPLENVSWVGKFKKRFSPVGIVFIRTMEKKE